MFEKEAFLSPGYCTENIKSNEHAIIFNAMNQFEIDHFDWDTVLKSVIPGHEFSINCETLKLKAAQSIFLRNET